MEELGAGFVLATHDLEIRGAGELLGEQQSGQMTEIGLAMYLDMLEQAVKALKEGREPALDRPLAATAEVELRVPAFLPESYVARRARAPGAVQAHRGGPRQRGDRRADRGDRRPLRPAAAAGHEPAAHRPTQADGTRPRNPPTRSGPAGRLCAVRGNRTRSTRGRSYAWCSTPTAITAWKARSSCASRSRPTNGAERFEFAEKFLGRAARRRRQTVPRTDNAAPKPAAGKRNEPAILSHHDRSSRCPASPAVSRCWPAPSSRPPPAQNRGLAPHVHGRVIVFRNISGSGGPEDWSVKAGRARPRQHRMPPVAPAGSCRPSRRRSSSSRMSRRKPAELVQLSTHRAFRLAADRELLGLARRASRSRSSLAACRASPASSTSKRRHYLHLGMALNYRRRARRRSRGRARHARSYLSESRRVQVRRVNYFDHPAFGVIALVTPVSDGRADRAVRAGDAGHQSRNWQTGSFTAVDLRLLVPGTTCTASPAS